VEGVDFHAGMTGSPGGRVADPGRGVETWVDPPRISLSNNLNQESLERSARRPISRGWLARAEQLKAPVARHLRWQPQA